MYNFGIPAAMKAWIDQVVRAGRTFQFTPNRTGRPQRHRPGVDRHGVGGTTIGGDRDFNTTSLRAVLSFIGVRQVEIIAAERLQIEGEAAVARGFAAIDAAFA